MHQQPSQMHPAGLVQGIALGGGGGGGRDNVATVYAPGIQNEQMLEQGERQKKVRRYLEKKRSRKSDGKKTVRYISRKRYAGARPRIRGRFVKTETTTTVSGERDDGGGAGGSVGGDGAGGDFEDDDDTIRTDADMAREDATAPPYAIIDAAEVTTTSTGRDSDMVGRRTPPIVARTLQPKDRFVQNEERESE